MDVLHKIGDFWVRRNADPSPEAIARVEGLVPATVITGASEGLGFALARRLAREGRTVVMLARTTEALEDAAKALSISFPGSRIIAEALDVSEPTAPQALDALLARHQLYLDVLVNNAGIGLGGEFSALTEAELDQLVATNIAALTRLTRHYLPKMRERARGGIMNLASLASFVPGPWQAPYFASKAYVLSLTAAIGSECAGEGVRVCVIAPGPIETRIHRKMRTTNTFYRLLLPSISADRMARLAWRSYRLGRRVVVPGFVNSVFAWSGRALPFEILLPLVGWLMRPRPRPVRGMNTRMRAQKTLDQMASIRDLDVDGEAIVGANEPRRERQRGKVASHDRHALQGRP
jgi:short-subunit dehydrogenase